MKIAKEGAQALVELLNGQTWSPAVTAVRAARFRFDHRDVPTTLSLTVIPESQRDVSLGTRRGDAATEWKVSIVLLQRLESIENDAVDPLFDLQDAIDTFLRTSVAITVAGKSYAWADIDSSYVRDHLNKHRIFTGGLLVTFKGGRL